MTVPVPEDEEDFDFVLHFDVNKTILMIDSVTNKQVDHIATSILASCCWGEIVLNEEGKAGRWDPRSIEPSPLRPDGFLRSYQGFVREKMPYTKGGDKAAVKKARDAMVMSFCDEGEPGFRYRSFRDRLLTQLRVPEGSCPKELERVGLRDHLLTLPAFFRLIERLVCGRREGEQGERGAGAGVKEGAKKKEEASSNLSEGDGSSSSTGGTLRGPRRFTLVFRTFGEDIGDVAKEFNAFCRGAHPLFPFSHPEHTVTEGETEKVVSAEREEKRGDRDQSSPSKVEGKGEEEGRRESAAIEGGDSAAASPFALPSDAVPFLFPSISPRTHSHQKGPPREKNPIMPGPSHTGSPLRPPQEKSVADLLIDLQDPQRCGTFLRNEKGTHLVLGTVKQPPADSKDACSLEWFTGPGSEGVEVFEGTDLAAVVFSRVCSRGRTVALRDHYAWWRTHGEEACAGKPLLLNPFDFRKLHIFLDDNIQRTDPHIVDARFKVGGEWRVLPFSYVNGVHLLRSEPLEAITDSDYFVKMIASAEGRWRERRRVVKKMRQNDDADGARELLQKLVSDVAKEGGRSQTQQFANSKKLDALANLFGPDFAQTTLLMFEWERAKRPTADDLSVCAQIVTPNLSQEKEWEALQEKKRKRRAEQLSSQASKSSDHSRSRPVFGLNPQDEAKRNKIEAKGGLRDLVRGAAFSLGKLNEEPDSDEETAFFAYPPSVRRDKMDKKLKYVSVKHRPQGDHAGHHLVWFEFRMAVGKYLHPSRRDETLQLRFDAKADTSAEVGKTYKRVKDALDLVKMYKKDTSGWPTYTEADRPTITVFFDFSQPGQPQPFWATAGDGGQPDPEGRFFLTEYGWEEGVQLAQSRAGHKGRFSLADLFSLE
uniref:Uncharacterized protein n=1 Tax=Chromera velia CCMP2878 TaxID=1169474 RepID=A0A0G4IBP0_9ALVE|eukprot:Cvel_12880.t1-p1 / transcript=Cvel_12880.t1 / gene=Cvel_12880 / organism=Chromera_velia_CCMP2878 / gene_product=hypothetical protein / transcript_product=hypothetical protein / location=Cvel_scaffold860:15718-22018(-) / protein_length=877 / sequence_SO=supercontig / SO=protein_coding / is_pseudo=false